MNDTRQLILEKNFHAMHRQGFQGTRPDKVLAEVGITKGAFYHYFPDKRSMGYAVVEEILHPMYVGAWLALEDPQFDPIPTLIQAIEGHLAHANPEMVALGCPLNNLIQEMSPLDEGFRLRLRRIIDRQLELIRLSLERAQAAGSIRQDVHPEAVAHFILAAIEGSYSIAKSCQSPEVFRQSIGQLVAFVQGLTR